MPREYWVYIMTNQRHTVLYTGVTSNIEARIQAHREKKNPKSFTARYNVEKLVWCESTDDVSAAIAKEKQIKAGSRAKKIAIINAMNPEWKDLLGE
jgi:putative endonuclease